MSSNNQVTNSEVKIPYFRFMPQNDYVSYEKYGIDRNSFICPLCGKKSLVSEAVHHSVETNRKNYFTYDQVTYHNIRICRECEANRQKGDVFSILLTACLILLFYVIFTYFYFYTENAVANYILGNLYERNGFVFFLIVVGVIFVSPVLWMFCRLFCRRWYKDLWLPYIAPLGPSELWEAYEKNAIAPIDEKDQ